MFLFISSKSYVLIHFNTDITEHNVGIINRFLINKCSVLNILELQYLHFKHKNTKDLIKTNTKAFTKSPKNK